mgnify:CR=1 FL=1
MVEVGFAPVAGVGGDLRGCADVFNCLVHQADEMRVSAAWFVRVAATMI